VETRFSILSRRATRRGAFTSVRALTEATQRFLDHWNDDCKPFVSSNYGTFLDSHEPLRMSDSS
jgi:hypothetical protein